MLLLVLIIKILPWAIVIYLLAKLVKGRDMHQYSDGVKVVHVILSDDYDYDIIECLKKINNKGEFFKRAVRKYLAENKVFKKGNSTVDAFYDEYE